jgi:hypothetical protein
MATYDPKRNRPAITERPDAPAPVDALLDSFEWPVVSGTEIPDADTGIDLRDGATREFGLPRPAVVDSPIEPLPGPDRLTQRIAIVAGMVAAVTAAVVLWRQWRRRN